MAKKINQALDKLAFRTGTRREEFSHAEVKPAASVRFLFQDKTFVFLNRIMFNRDTDEQKEGDTSRQARMDPPRSSSKNKPTHIHQ